jgi:hypothetical protein
VAAAAVVTHKYLFLVVQVEELLTQTLVQQEIPHQHLQFKVILVVTHLLQHLTTVAAVAEAQVE